MNSVYKILLTAILNLFVLVSSEVPIKINDSKKVHIIEKNIIKTIDTININKYYLIMGRMLPYGKKNDYFGKATITINDSSFNGVQEILDNFIKFQDTQDTSEQPMQLIFEIGKHVQIINSKISLKTTSDKKIAKCSIKYGLLPRINRDYEIKNFPIISMFLNNTLSLNNMRYKIVEYKNLTCIILFSQKQVTQDGAHIIGDFAIIILGAKYKKLYHIYNIVGIIFGIEGRIITMKVNEIKHRQNAHACVC